MKIAINKCYGGFSVSKEVYDYLGMKWDGYGYDFSDKEKRSDPKLIEAIEKLGDSANGRFAQIEIVEIPDDIDFTIEEYDGIEWIAEVHRTWG